MENNLSYVAADGREVTIDYLEEICTEIGYLLHGTIVNLTDLYCAQEISDEQCARLVLSLTGLKSIKDRLDSIFPAAENN